MFPIPSQLSLNAGKSSLLGNVQTHITPLQPELSIDISASQNEKANNIKRLVSSFKSVIRQRRRVSRGSGKKIPSDTVTTQVIISPETSATA